MDEIKSHRLAAGQTIQSKYTKLGGMVGTQVLDPAMVSALIWGFPDAGKSTWIEGHEGAYIFNCDGTSTSNPEPKAIIYPGFNDQGQTVNEKLKVIKFTHDELREKVAVLEAMSLADEPRPQTIVLDSLTSLINMIKEWVPEHLYDSTKGKSFRQLDGQMGWDAVYSEVTSLIQRIRNAGYGCYIIAHLKFDIKNRGKEGEKECIFPTITANFASRLLALTEMSISIRSKQEYKVGGFQKVVTLDVAIPELMEQNIYKYRVPVEMELPHVGGWDAYVKKYKDSLDELNKVT